MIKKPILILALCIICISLNAHNAKIATFTLRDTGAGWMIEMAFAQASVDMAMQNIYGREKLKNIAKETYRDAVVEYVKEHFELKSDGKDIKLTDGGIMLGSHQSNLKFVLSGISQDPENMEVHIPMFGNEHNHTNILRVYRGGSKISKVFLSSDNKFKSMINFDQNGHVSFSEISEDDKMSLNLGVSFGALFLLVFGFILYRKKRNNYYSSKMYNVDI